MTTPSDTAAGPELVPVPVRVVLPADPLLGTEQQEIVARLWKRRQTETGWAYLVGLPSYRDREDGGVEAAEYRVWVHAPDHVRPVDGVDYEQVVTEKLERSPQSVVREVLGERRPSGWVLAKVPDDRGPARSVLHAPDCEEAPAGAPLLDVDRALDAADPAVHAVRRRAGAVTSAARLRPHHRIRPRRLLTLAAAPSAALARWPRPARNTGEHAPIPSPAARDLTHHPPSLFFLLWGVVRGRRGDVRGPTTPVRWE